MGGRGTFAAGNSVDYTYKTVGYIEDVKANAKGYEMLGRAYLAQLQKKRKIG